MLFEKTSANLKSYDKIKYSCVKCGAYKISESPKIPPFGEGKKKIMFITGVPNSQEQKNGILWADKNDRFFIKKILSFFNLDLKQDCVTVSSLRCGIDGEAEFVCCQYLLKLAIIKYEPEIIIPLSGRALASLIQHYPHKLNTINSWEGRVFYDTILKAWVCPNLSIHNSSDIQKIFINKGLKRALSLVTTKVLTPNLNQKIHYEKTFDFLDNIKSGSIVCIDYETTGLKPYQKEKHKIVSVSVAISANEAYSILTLDVDWTKFIHFLKRKDIKKIAHNMKYEDMWSENILGTKVTNWYWDTIIAQHILDNRGGVKNLDFVNYIYNGEADYSSEIKPYLKSNSKDTNATNKLVQFVTSNLTNARLLLKYNAKDTMATYSIYEKQIVLIKRLYLENTYRLFHKGALNLRKIEQNGINIDTNYLNSITSKLNNKIKNLEKRFFATKFYADWKKINPNVNIYSSAQLSKYLYNELKLKPDKKTKKGKQSTDEEVLSRFNIPELNLYIKIKKHLKLRSTYFDGLVRETKDGIVHPFFNVFFVSSYRGSCSNPNVQNIPIRNPKIANLIRPNIIPRKGNFIAELDFKQLEVCISACYCKDPVLIDYITSGKDMHKDIAIEIFKLSEFDPIRDKKLRSASKNGFVFPQFYGDYYKACAEHLAVGWCELPKTRWNYKMGVMYDNAPISAYLNSIGITSYNKFERHLKRIEYHLWYEKFNDYRKWKEKWWNMYLKTGSYRSLVGFQYSNVFSKNFALNSPIQGSAFHVLLWCLNTLQDWIDKNHMNSKIISNIHDSIILDIVPNERVALLKKARNIMEKEVRANWKWIIVPLTASIDVTGIDESWYMKKEVKWEQMLTP